MDEEEVAAFVVSMAVACILLALLVKLHLALCSQRLPPGWHAHAQKCAQQTLRLQFHMEIRTFFSMSPLYLQTFPACPKFARVEFLGALDDEEFFVVESDKLPGDLPPISLSDFASPCRCDHTHRTSRHVFETTHNNNTQQQHTTTTQQQQQQHTNKKMTENDRQ